MDTLRKYSLADSKQIASADDSSDPEKIADRKLSVAVGVTGGKEEADYTHRKLKPRHVQLIGIGGTIGTALFVQIGKGLTQGGPAGLFIAFTFWCSVVLSVTVCMAEMATYLPISSPFIRFAGRYVDDAFGVAAGWNFFVFEAALVPFEIVACNVILQFWTTAIPVGAVIAIVIVLYLIINILAVKWFGETEFWAALGKVLLIIGLLIMTFIVMLGGNPIGDRFGFRYWKNPGSFAEFQNSSLTYSSSTAKFIGFLACVIQASFTIAGPDYVSMAAGETENPRKTMPKAYKGVFYRLTAFFVLGSLAVGILVPYDDAELNAAINDGQPGAAASPYVVAMKRLNIGVLPHIVNAMVLASAFSAGNSYVYCASRSLFGLALEGKAPAIFAKCTRNGVPIFSVILVLLISLLSFLQLNNNSAIVLSWFVSLVTASQLINFAFMCITFLWWKKACEAQGLERKGLPFFGWWQPWVAYYGLFWTTIFVFVGGYAVFLPGNWDVPTFLFSYTMVGVCPLLYIYWKFVRIHWTSIPYVGYPTFGHFTHMRTPLEADITTGVAEIEEYTAAYAPRPPKNEAHRIGSKVAAKLHLW